MTDKPLVEGEVRWCCLSSAHFSGVDTLQIGFDDAAGLVVYGRPLSTIVILGEPVHLVNAHAWLATALEDAAAGGRCVPTAAVFPDLPGGRIVIGVASKPGGWSPPAEKAVPFYQRRRQSRPLGVAERFEGQYQQTPLPAAQALPHGVVVLNAATGPVGQDWDGRVKPVDRLAYADPPVMADHDPERRLTAEEIARLKEQLANEFRGVKVYRPLGPLDAQVCEVRTADVVPAPGGGTQLSVGMTVEAIDRIDAKRFLPGRLHQADIPATLDFGPDVAALDARDGRQFIVVDDPLRPGQAAPDRPAMEAFVLGDADDGGPAPIVIPRPESDR